MKKYTVSIFIFLLVLSITSCRNNRLKTDEKELSKELLIKEREKGESETLAKGTHESEAGSMISGTSRKKEIRAVDPGRPLIHLDIPGTQGNTRNIKLSDVASSIRYVKLQTPPDTTLLYDHFFYRPDLESNIRSDGEQIVFQGLFGVTRFNMNGEYKETIWKNETGIRLIGKSAMFGGQDFFGVKFHIPVSLSNGNLYFDFHDGPAGTGQVMKYQYEKNKTLPVRSQTEIPQQATVPGERLFNTTESSQKRFSGIYGLGSDSWAGINNEWNAGSTGTLLVTFNDNGDTLCRFSEFDRIVNFSLPASRRAIELASYTFDGHLTIKPEYNDTVFRLLPPDRLLPVYIIDFGKYKFRKMDGLNPDFDLSEKYMLKSLKETADYLLIRYTLNYDAPVTRKKNTAKFYNALFNKKEGILYHQPGYTLLPEGLINDIDGGIQFWPEFITPQGEMMKLVSGKIIRDYVNSEEFKKADISQENRRKQISLSSGLRASDMVIVIVK